MDTLVLAIQLVLGVVFATAGVAKLLDQDGSRVALEGFGLGPRLVRVAAPVLPIVELSTAVALVFPATARWGALAAVFLLLAFVAGIARALSRGEAPDCHCFGQLHSAPAGRGTLIRNGVLALLAGVVVVHGPGNAVDTWVDARSGAELAAVVAGILAVILGAFCLRLWLDKRSLQTDLAREREAIALFPPGLPPGAAAPDFSLPDLRGQTVSLESVLERGRPAALVFVSPGCGPCASLIPDLGRWQATLQDDLTVALLTSGGVADNFQAQEHGLAHVLLQEDAEVMRAYRVQATPSAVIVTPDGRVASPTAAGVPAIEPLIRLTLKGQTTKAGEGVASTNGAGAEQPQASA